MINQNRNCVICHLIGSTRIQIFTTKFYIFPMPWVTCNQKEFISLNTNQQWRLVSTKHATVVEMYLSIISGFEACNYAQINLNHSDFSSLFWSLHGVGKSNIHHGYDKHTNQCKYNGLQFSKFTENAFRDGIQHK